MVIGPQSFTRCAHALSLMLTMGCCIGGHSAAAQQSAGRNARPVELAVTFDAVRFNHVSTGTSFYLEGGSIELAAPVYRGLEVAASVTGAYATSKSPLVAGLDLVTVVFGPRYRYAPKRSRIAVFAQALAGEADGFHSVFALGSGPVSNPANGTTTSSNSLAVEAGGVLDLRLTPAVALRLVEADYLRTQLPNGATNVQNNLRLAGGIVVRWGN